MNGLNMTYGEYLMEKGVEKGKAEGRLMEKLKIAKNFLGFVDHQTIAQNTGLSLEEVEKLALEEENLADES